MSRIALSALLALLAVACFPAVRAQDRPASASSSGMQDMQDMDGMEGMDGMAGMDHGSMHPTAAAPRPQAPGAAPQVTATPGHTHGMQEAPSAVHTMPPYATDPMHGDRPAPDARDPDYSDGIDAQSTHGAGMAMADTGRIALLRVDQLEAFHGTHGSGQQWAIEAGYGSDRDKLWLRSEGARSGGRLDDADAEILWSHAAAAFWNTEVGLRTDAGEGPDRHWAAFGIQGLAPYWFELSLTGYAGPAGRTAMRLRSEYELLFTQRLVLQPELEINAYGRADPARGLGSGVSDATLGLRLRYELRRQFAPYAGVTWIRRFGATAAAQGHSERRWVAGLRMWF
jgi:copper resistance protein B